MQIEEFDVHSSDHETLEAVHQAFVDLESEFATDQPEPPLAHHLAIWTAPPSSHRTDMRWVARQQDEVVGAAHAVTWIDHADSGLVTLAVPRDRRGQGVGSELFGVALEGLESEGRSKVIVDIPIDSPAEKAAARLGLKKVFSEEINQLQVNEIDWDLMDSWIEQAKQRATDYQLLALSNPLPEEHLDNWCRISDVMNTAPMEEFDLEDTHMSPEKWRSIEASYGSRGLVMHALVAVHEPTGDFAGMTAILYQSHHPQVALQDDTVVDPDHRNRGLGRWLKASMARAFVSEHPDVELIDTGNAGSNAPMLSINKAMGFRTIARVGAWQGSISDARTALSTGS